MHSKPDSSTKRGTILVIILNVRICMKTCRR